MDKKKIKNTTSCKEFEDDDDDNDCDYDQEIIDYELYIEKQYEDNNKISLEIFESIKKYLDNNCLPIGEYLTVNNVFDFINR